MNSLVVGFVIVVLMLPVWELQSFQINLVVFNISRDLLWKIVNVASVQQWSQQGRVQFDRKEENIRQTLVLSARKF